VNKQVQLQSDLPKTLTFKNAFEKNTPQTQQNNLQLNFVASILLLHWFSLLHIFE